MLIRYHTQLMPESFWSLLQLFNRVMVSSSPLRGARIKYLRHFSQETVPWGAMVSFPSTFALTAAAEVLEAHRVLVSHLLLGMWSSASHIVTVSFTRVSIIGSDHHSGHWSHNHNYSVRVVPLSLVSAVVFAAIVT